MLQSWVVLPVALAYIGILFAIARYGDKRADEGRSIIANPYTYALSLGVYATAWTFYGSVGRAAGDGVGFLPIYIGPTLMMALWWLVMRKIIRISKTNRITSLADFISSRYGKSALLAGLVTIIAVVGVIPYIALQLKAVSSSFTILVRYPEVAAIAPHAAVPVLADTAFWTAILLATFTILFGTRHLETSERHEGLVAAIAFESLVKLVAFLAVGVFVTWGIYAGLPDLFARAGAHPRLATLQAPLGGGGRQLRELGLAHGAVDARHHVPAAAIPGRGGREREREPHPQGDLALSALHAGDEPVRRAGRVRRRHALHGRARRSGHVRADAADGGKAGGARALRLHRRPVRRHRHGHRRDDRAVDDGLQRPRDAGAAAHAVDAAGRAAQPDRAPARHSPRGDRRRRAAGLPLLPAGGRGLCARRDRPHLVRRGRAVRAGHHRRHLLEGRDSRRRARRTPRRLRRVALHAAPAVIREIGMAAARIPRRRAVRHRAASPVRAVRPRGPQRHHPCDAVEHARQRRRLRHRFGALAPVGRRAGAGCAIRRRVPPRRRRAGRPCLEGNGVGARAAGAARAFPRRRAGERSAHRLRASPRRRHGRSGAGGRGSCPVRGNGAGRRDRRSVGADHGGLRREGRHAHVRRSPLDARRGVAGHRLQSRAEAEIARAHDGDRRACVPRTCACRSSTG